MAHIKLDYTCSSNTDLQAVVREIEYGNTFVIDGQKEKLVPIPGEKQEWVKVNSKSENHFSLSVNDAFFELDCFFEKVVTAFIFNFLDFGDIRLEAIDIKQSELQFNQQAKNSSNNEIFAEFPALGTIFKPYYHFALKEKLRMASRLTEIGINVIKEDETYLVGKERILSEARQIQETMGEKAFYVPNVTSYVQDVDFIAVLTRIGIRIVMVNFLITGFRPIFHLKQQLLGLKIWGHRVGYKSLLDVVSMRALAKLSVLSGINYLHLGTTLKANQLVGQNELIGDLRQLNPGFLPIFTKTSPEIIPTLLSRLSSKLILMACGYFRSETTGHLDWERIRTWVERAKFEKKENDNGTS